MTNLCSPSTMCGPFCSVPAVPTITVVWPAATRSRTSAQVSSSMKTVSGALPDDMVAGASAGRWAETESAKTNRDAKTVNKVRFVMAVDYNKPMRLISSVVFALLVAGCASGKGATPPSAQPAPAQPSATASPLRQQWLDMFARGYFPGRSGQLFVVPKQGWFVTSRDPLYFFMHGSPWDYDTHIPVLFYGAPFVKAGQYPAAAKQQDVAPTIG